jgi:hypothetical protein
VRLWILSDRHVELTRGWDLRPFWAGAYASKTRRESYRSGESGTFFPDAANTQKAPQNKDSKKTGRVL